MPFGRIRFAYTFSLFVCLLGFFRWRRGEMTFAYVMPFHANCSIHVVSHAHFNSITIANNINIWNLENFTFFLAHYSAYLSTIPIIVAKCRFIECYRLATEWNMNAFLFSSALSLEAQKNVMRLYVHYSIFFGGPARGWEIIVYVCDCIEIDDGFFVGHCWPRTFVPRCFINFHCNFSSLSADMKHRL